LKSLRDQWQRDAERSAQLVSQEARHNLLLEQRQGHEAQRLIQEEADRLLAADREIQQQNEIAREKRIHSQQQEMLLIYNRQRQVESDKLAAVIKEQEARMAADLAEESALNKERVEYRKGKIVEQRERKHLAQQRAYDLLMDREARLSALRDSVAISVVHDPQRLLRPTAASSAESQPGQLSTLFPVYGYDLDGIFADPRARLASALYCAGIITNNNQYAREILQKTTGAKPTRKDMMQSELP
jgi:hypothetical protein